MAKVGSKGRVLDGGERDRGEIFNFALFTLEFLQFLMMTRMATIIRF